MFPWYWFWMPHLDFPLSGDVQQGWNLLFRHISPQAGRGLLEQKIFTETASYGTQLGLLTDVLMQLVENCPNSGNIKKSEAYKTLETKNAEIKVQIQKDRQEHREQLIQSLKDWIKRINADPNAKAEKDALKQTLMNCF